MSATTVLRHVRRVALSVLLATSALTAKADNFGDALAGAYRNSGLLEQNRALLRAADEDAAIALSQLRPIVDFTLSLANSLDRTRAAGLLVSDGSDTTLTGTLQADLVLYNGGQFRLNTDSAKETVLATRQALLSIEQDVLFRAATAYLTVLLQNDNVALRRSNVRLLQEELRAARDRFEVGEVTRTDVALAESSLAAARSSLADAEGDLRIAQAEYTAAVGVEAHPLEGPPAMPRMPASVNAAIATARANHPDIKQRQHQVAAAELAIMATRAQLGPTLLGRASLAGVEGFDSSTVSTDSTLSVILSQRLYQGGGRAAAVRRSAAVRDQLRGLLINTERTVANEVKQAFVSVQVARANLTASAERVRAAQVAFDGIREEATLGARTTLDVLAAEQELLDARTAQIQARSQQLLAGYQLLQAQGLLTAEKLNLAVQLYDPAAYYNLVKDAPAFRSKRSRKLDRVLKSLGKN